MGTAFDFKQLQAVTLDSLPEHHTEGLGFEGQAMPAVDLWFLPPGATYNVAFKPGDDAPLSKRSGDKPSSKRLGDKPSLKRSGDKPSSKCSADKAPPMVEDKKKREEDEGPKCTDTKLSPKYLAAEEQLRLAREQLVDLERALNRVTWRVRLLDSKPQEIALTGEIRIDLEHMMEQLEELRREVKRYPNQFEWVMARRYPPLEQRIETIDRKLDDVESPWYEVKEKVKRFLRLNVWP